MKYRIIEKLKNGKKIYFPQYKKFLKWHYFKNVYGIRSTEQLDYAKGLIENHKKDTTYKTIIWEVKND